MSQAEEKMTDTLAAFVEEWKDKPGNLVMVLHKIQEEYGYIPRSIAFALSRKLNVPLAQIYGVITFYHFFKLNKPGKHTLQVCLGTACYLKGSADLLQECKNLLGIGVGQTTDDGEFSMETVRCIGCCGLSPVTVCDGEVFGRLTKKEIPGILKKIRERGKNTLQPL